jgi:hypothetical protein
MKFGLSLSFIFKDEYWFKKITLPAICSLIPILGQIVQLGWALQISLNIIHQVEEPLPDLNFGEDLKRGLGSLAIGLAYDLPIFILSILTTLGSSALLNATSLSVKEIDVINIFLSIVLWIIYLAVYLFTQPATMNYVTKGELKAAFKWDEVWQMLSANPWDWILVMVGTAIIGAVLNLLGLIACIIGFFFTRAIFFAAVGHLTGQAYLRSLPKVEIVEEIAE